MECQRTIKCALFFIGPLGETSYFRMYVTDLYQIFTVGTHIMGMINLTFFPRSLKGRCYGNRFLAPISDSWHTRFYSVRWHSTTYERIATWMHALTPQMTPLRLITIW